MKSVLGSGVRSRVGCTNEPSCRARHRQLALDAVLLEVRDRQPRQMNDREHVELKQLPIDVDVDFVPLSPLWSTGVVHKNVERPKVSNDPVEAVLMISEFQHIQRNDEDILGPEAALRQWQALLLRRLQLANVARRENEFHAIFREHFGEFTPNATRRASDPHDFASEAA